jgi:hypothetical protein
VQLEGKSKSIVTNASVLNPIQPPPAPAFIGVGSSGGNMFFGTRTVFYDALGDINNVGQAVDVLNAGTGDIHDGAAPMVNHADTGPGGNAGGGYSITRDPNIRYQGDPDGDTDDVILLANGVRSIQIRWASLHAGVLSAYSLMLSNPPR